MPHPFRRNLRSALSGPYRRGERWEGIPNTISARMSRKIDRESTGSAVGVALFEHRFSFDRVARSVLLRARCRRMNVALPQSYSF
jgi:hypothetical protein